MKINLTKLKKLYFLILTLVIFLICCQNPGNLEKDTTVNLYPPDSSVKYLKQILSDTLNKYADASEYLRKDDKYVLYIHEINNKKIGIMAITDSVLFLFQKEKNGWYQVDSIIFENYAFSFGIKDINGDRKNDLIVYGFPNMHGQCFPFVFMSKTNYNLDFRPDINLMNINFDTAKNLVQSYYIGGVYTTIYKEYHKWEGDSLVLVRGVEHCPPFGSDRYPTVTFYKLKRGNRFDYKKILDKKGTVYDTALWEGYY